MLTQVKPFPAAEENPQLPASSPGAASARWQLQVLQARRGARQPAQHSLIAGVTSSGKRFEARAAARRALGLYGKSRRRGLGLASGFLHATTSS